MSKTVNFKEQIVSELPLSISILPATRSEEVALM